MRIELLALVLDFGDARVGIGRIEDRDAIAHQFAMADRFGLQARAALARDRHQADVRHVAQGKQTGAQLGIGIVGADIDIVDHAGHVVDTTGERMARRRGSPVRQMIDQRFRAEPDAAQLGRGGGAIAQADIERFALGPAILAPQRAVHVAEDARGIAGVTGIEAEIPEHLVRDHLFVARRLGRIGPAQQR